MSSKIYSSRMITSANKKALAHLTFGIWLSSLVFNFSGDYHFLVIIHFKLCTCFEYPPTSTISCNTIFSVNFCNIFWAPRFGVPRKNFKLILNINEYLGIFISLYFYILIHNFCPREVFK